MSRIQDRVKQRREYLRKKGGVYTTVTLLTLLIVFFAFMTLLLATGALGGFIERGNPDLAMFGLVCSILVCVSATATWSLVDINRKARQSVSRLPYVPPVTSDTLPAEEVLLRASDASGQEQKHVLLRGTHNTEETDGQELLRSSQGKK